jgi:L-ascorbate metabolism protein UlaG (beta-lactamase superfamily)
MPTNDQSCCMITRRRMLVMAGGALAASAAATLPGRPAFAQSAPLKITQMRNATLRVDIGGVRFLIDPMLAEQGAYPGFEGTVNSEQRNPLVPLTLPMDEVLNVDAVIVTHTHPDHWDEAAKALLPKELPVFAQNEDDAGLIRSAGFTDVRVLAEETEFNGVTLSKTGGQHGSDAAYEVLGEILGQVCGVVFRHPEAKTLYIAGDTIWNHHVEEALARHQPEVIVLNSGDAQVPGVGSIIMGTADVKAVHEAAPAATLIGSHMEAVNHCVLTRAELRAFAEQEGFPDSLLIPADGETITI